MPRILTAMVHKRHSTFNHTSKGGRFRTFESNKCLVTTVSAYCSVVLFFFRLLIIYGQHWCISRHFPADDELQNIWLWFVRSVSNRIVQCHRVMCQDGGILITWSSEYASVKSLPWVKLNIYPFTRYFCYLPCKLMQWRYKQAPTHTNTHTHTHKYTHIHTWHGKYIHLLWWAPPSMPSVVKVAGCQTAFIFLSVDSS